MQIANVKCDASRRASDNAMWLAPASASASAGAAAAAAPASEHL